MKRAGFLPLAILAASLGMALADPYSQLVTYDWAQSRRPLADIERQIREAKGPEDLRAVEQKLIRVVANPKATYAGKQFACRMLRRCGSEACVDALARLLTDPKLSHMARFALQGNASPKAGQALREALGKVPDELKIGMLSSLGARREAQAVGEIASLLKNQNTRLVETAIRALGSIATPEAANALQRASVPASLEGRRADALMMCADRMRADGKTDQAVAIYSRVLDNAPTAATRGAALRGLALAQGVEAVPRLVALMDAKDETLVEVARRVLIMTPGEEMTKALASRLSAATSTQQVALLDILTARGDKSAGAQVAKLVASKDEAVRLAAVRALGTLGDASCVPALVRASMSKDEVAQAAAESLARLRGDEVGVALGKLLESPEATVRAAVLGVIARRGDKSAAPAVLRLARSGDPAVRKAAIDALGAVAAPEHLPQLADLLVTTKDPGERGGLMRVLTAVANRSDDIEGRTAPLVAVLTKADEDATCRLLGLLGRLGGKNALEAVRARLKARSENVATAAVRALHQWPDPAAAPDLLRVIKTTKNPIHRVLAFRGYVNMANLVASRSGGEADEMYAQALRLAKSPDEKRSVLGGLGAARSLEALKLAQALLGDAQVRAEAEVAVVQVAANCRQLAPAEARDALEEIIASTKNKALAKQASGVIAEMDRYKGFITTWLGAGPYTKGDPFKTTYPPEKGEPGVEWKVLTQGVGAQSIDLERAIGRGSNRAAYMLAYLWSPADQDVRLEIGSDDGVKVWVNDKLAHANNVARPLRIGQDKARARLKKGWNRLLVKIAQQGGQWAFSFRVCRPDGRALDGLKVSLKPQ